MAAALYPEWHGTQVCVVLRDTVLKVTNSRSIVPTHLILKRSLEIGIFSHFCLYHHRAGRAGTFRIGKLLVAFDKVMNFYYFYAVFMILPSWTQIFVELKSRTVSLSVYSICSFFVDVNSADQHCQMSVQTSSARKRNRNRTFIIYIFIYLCVYVQWDYFFILAPMYQGDLC